MFPLKKNLRLLLQGRHVGRGGAHSYKSVIRKVEGEIAIFKGNIWKNMQTYIFWIILIYFAWMYQSMEIWISSLQNVVIPMPKSTQDCQICSCTGAACEKHQRLRCGLSAHQCSCCVRFVSRQSSGEWTQGVVHRQLQCQDRCDFATIWH